jgi:hypothetical protein
MEEVRIALMLATPLKLWLHLLLRNLLLKRLLKLLLLKQLLLKLLLFKLLLLLKLLQRPHHHHPVHVGVSTGQATVKRTQRLNTMEIVPIAMKTTIIDSAKNVQNRTIARGVANQFPS